MHRFDLCETYRAEAEVAPDTRIGEIYHVRRNTVGKGSVSTPIAGFFVWRPNILYAKPHWRVDCFVRDHPLAEDPKGLGRMLTDKLVELELCEEPIWTSWYVSSEAGGERRGDLWDD